MRYRDLNLVEKKGVLTPEAEEAERKECQELEVGEALNVENGAKQHEVEETSPVQANLEEALEEKAPKSERERVMNKKQSGKESKNPLTQLGRAGDETIVDMKGLAKIFGRSIDTIKRAVVRGELPKPVKFLGQQAWTVKTIIQHMEMRLAEEGEK